MEILNNNFAENLKFVIASINTADFVTMDTEFSGLSVGFEDQTNGFDQAEDRYQKLKHNCSRMNAFQIGICTFKWDPAHSCYSERPFNVYVFPHSEILGNSTLQFKASNIRFLMKHNFDFNKLFASGVNYQRLSDKQRVYDKVQQQTDLAIVNAGSTQVNYNPHRSFTSIGNTSQKSLDHYLRKVANFVELAKRSDEWLSIDFTIESYALRRKLSENLQFLYKDRNLIYTQFSSNSTTFTVRKWKSNNSAADQKKQQQEVKLSPDQIDESAFDKILKGDRDGLTVIHEDDKCVAFYDKSPVAKSHFIVLAKTIEFTSL